MLEDQTIQITCTLLPETVKKLVRSGKITDDYIRTATLRNGEIIDRLYVFWDDNRGCYVARVITLKRSKPKLTEQCLYVHETLAPEREEYLRRLIRLELGIYCVGGYRTLEPKNIPAHVGAVE